VWSLILVVLAALVFFWAVGVQQRLKAGRQAMIHAFGLLDVHLARRHELLTLLVDEVRKHLPKEHDAHERVLAACRQAVAACELVRNGSTRPGPIRSLDLAEASLLSVVNRFTPLVTAHDLASQDPVIAETLQALARNDQNVLYARGVFNDATEQHNLSLDRFPAGLIAAVFGFEAMPLLQPMVRAE